MCPEVAGGGKDAVDPVEEGPAAVSQDGRVLGLHQVQVVVHVDLQHLEEL